MCLHRGSRSVRSSVPAGARPPLPGEGPIDARAAHSGEGGGLDRQSAQVLDFEIVHGGFSAGLGEQGSSIERGGRRQGRAFRAIEQDRTRLAEEVYRQILDAVIQGELRPGERIVQERIAVEIKVSGTAIREALLDLDLDLDLDLEREGVLTRGGAAGFMVRSVTPQEVRDIYQTREAIEGHATRLVAERRDRASLRRIEKTIESKESMSVGSVEEYFHTNRLIHRGIVEETGNEYLLSSFDRIWNRASSFRIFAGIETVDPGASLGEHREMFLAMRDRAPIEAGEAMVHHIRDGLELQLGAMDGETESA